MRIPARSIEEKRAMLKLYTSGKTLKQVGQAFNSITGPRIRQVLMKHCRLNNINWELMVRENRAARKQATK